MGTKVKGLLKGLRNIFDEKEQEIQIGFPTDVKHVAHIGWDGPAVNSPCWMGEFDSTTSAPLTGGGNGGTNELGISPNFSSPELSLDGGALAEKSSTRSTSSEKSSEKPKHSRRHKSTSDSPSRESSEDSRKGRRERRTSTSTGGSGSHDSAASSATQDPPGVPKTRPRKAKGSKEKEGSVRSRTKAATSDQQGEDGE